MHEERSVPGVVKSMDRFLVHKRKLRSLQNVYHSYLLIVTIFTVAVCVLPFLPMNSQIVFSISGVPVLVAGMYAFVKLYRIIDVLRYESISMQEAETRLIADFGFGLNFGKPGDLMRYIEMANRLESRLVLPERGFLVILLSFFVAGALFWTLQVAGILTI